MNFFGLRRKQSELSTSSQDPFNPDVFPDEIRQEIIGYLSVSDLLEATLVSKLWNATIGTSVHFKRKVVIKLHPWHSSRDDNGPSWIADSERSYENLTVADFKTNNTKFLTLENMNWKHVTLSIGKISSQKSFIKLMENLKAVKDLKILSTNIRELNTNKRIVLKNLESLLLSDVTLDLFDVLIANQPSLKKLSLRFVACDIASPRRVGEAITEFLSLNPNVKDLEMNFMVTNDLFLVNISTQVPLKLRVLSLGLDSTSRQVQENIEHFLRNQGENIEHLRFSLHQKFVQHSANEWGYWERRNIEEDRSSDDILMLFNVWNSMTSLKSLHVRFLQNSSELNLDRDLIKSLKRNVNIATLFVQFMNANAPSSIVIELIKLCPNLRTIYVSKLTPAIVRFCAINLVALRELKCFSFDGECEKEFNELKAARNDLNKFIVISDRCALG